MYTLKIKYELAKNRALELMNRGMIKEYIQHLAYMNRLKRELITLSN